MTRFYHGWILLAAIASLASIPSGCSTLGGGWDDDDCGDAGWAEYEGDCEDCDDGCCCLGCLMPGCCYYRSGAIPDVLPLGSIVRAHYHQMQTNAEASDFIFYRHDFVGYTAELTPAGKDRLLEVAARARSAPFPVLVERSEFNSDPALDAHRRQLIARILFDLGVPEADQRVIVAPAYSRGFTGPEGELNYSRYTLTRGGFGFGNGLGFGGATGAGIGVAGGLGAGGF